METTDNVLQRILDEHGYIVLGTNLTDVRIGEVIPRFWYFGVLEEITVVVTGFTTREESDALLRKYYPAEPLDEAATIFLKVVAE